MNERIGVTVNQLPVGLAAAEHERHTQGPVLLRKPADLTALPFNRHQHDQILAGVGLDQFKTRLAAAKESSRGLQGLIRRVKAAPRVPAVRGQERVVLSVLDQREVPADVALEIGRGGLRGAADEAREFLIGDRLPRDAQILIGLRSPFKCQRAIRLGSRGCVLADGPGEHLDQLVGDPRVAVDPDAIAGLGRS